MVCFYNTVKTKESSFCRSRKIRSFCSCAWYDDTCSFKICFLLFFTQPNIYPIQQFQTIFSPFLLMRAIFFKQKNLWIFAQKILFMLLLKIILWYFYNHDSLSRGKWFLMIASFYFCSSFLKVLNLDYSKNVLSSCIKYCSMNQAHLQYKWGCAVQVR